MSEDKQQGGAPAPSAEPRCDLLCCGIYHSYQWVFLNKRLVPCGVWRNKKLLNYYFFSPKRQTVTEISWFSVIWAHFPNFQFILWTELKVSFQSVIARKWTLKFWTLPDRTEKCLRCNIQCRVWCSAAPFCHLTSRMHRINTQSSPAAGPHTARRSHSGW